MMPSCAGFLIRSGGLRIPAPQPVERVSRALCRHFHNRAREESEKTTLLERETNFKQDSRFEAALANILHHARPRRCVISSGVVISLSRQKTCASDVPAVSKKDSSRTQRCADRARESLSFYPNDRFLSLAATSLSASSRDRLHRKTDRYCKSAYGVGCAGNTSFFSACESLWPRRVSMTDMSEANKRKHLVSTQGYRGYVVSASCSGSLCRYSCFMSIGHRSCFESSNSSSVFQRYLRQSFLSETLLAQHINRGSRNRIVDSSRSQRRDACNWSTSGTPSFSRLCTNYWGSRSSRSHPSTDGACKKKSYKVVDCTGIRFLWYCTLCRKRLPIETPSRRSWNSGGARCMWSVGMKLSVASNAIHPASHSFRSSTSLCLCTRCCWSHPGRPASPEIPSFFPSLSPVSPPSFLFSSRASSTPPLAGQPCASRQTLPSAVSPQAAVDAGLPAATTMPQPLSPEAFYEGEIEEDDTPGEFTRSLLMSDVATQERARLWLKFPVVAVADTDGSAKVVRQPPTLADGGAARVFTITTNAERSDRYDGVAAEQQQRREQTLHQSASVNRNVTDEGAEDAQEKQGGVCKEFEQKDTDNDSTDIFSSFQGELNPHPLYSRTCRRAAAATVSPGSTLLSRLAVAEREALLSIPRTAKRNKENSETVGIGGEVYPSTRIRRRILSQEQLGAAIEDDLQRLAFDRRQMPTPLKSASRGECLRLADRKRYQDTFTENEILGYEGVSRKRLRVLDIDSVPVAVLHHSFMFLLVRHLPAEICMKVISRIATYRDIHTQLAYENLIRDLGFLLTKHYESYTAIPHSLGPTFIAYLSRILQTISIAWSVDYIRRYGCFSKKFIAQQIERSTNPRLFDCVRYEKNGGVKPLPPIITHPHRLSSYVRLLDECSAKFYMYVHLKRHGQIPMQQQLQHQVAVQQHLEKGEAEKNIKSFQVSRAYGPCPAGQASSATPAVLTAPPENESIEMEHRLPRPFVAAEKLLQQNKATRRSRPFTEQQSGLPKPERGGYLKERGRDGNLRNETLATKRPEMYDLILAAEHLGLDYRLLQKQALLRKTTENDAVFKEDGDEETPSTAFHGKEVEVCSDDEEDPDELELRELLVDDEEIYRHILHRYIRRKNGPAEVDSAPEGGDKADELDKDEVLRGKTDAGADGGDTDRGLAQKRCQDERRLRTSLPVDVATTGGEMVGAHTSDASGGTSVYLPIHAGNEDGSICEAFAQGKVDRNDGSQSYSVLRHTDEKVQDSYGRLLMKYAAAEDALELSSAADTVAERSTLVNDADPQKHGTSTVLPVYYFTTGSALPCVDHINPSNPSALSSTGGAHLAVASITHTGALHCSDTACCRTRSAAVRGKAENTKGERVSLLENVGSSASSTGTPGRSKESTNSAPAHFDSNSPVVSGATFRMQNTFVAPLEWMSRSRVRSRRDKRASAVENALLPCIRDHDDEAQWGWQWNFTVDKSGAPHAHKGLEEEGCAATGGTKERWWRTPWGRNRAFFRFKGDLVEMIIMNEVSAWSCRREA